MSYILTSERMDDIRHTAGCRRNDGTDYDLCALLAHHDAKVAELQRQKAELAVSLQMAVKEGCDCDLLYGKICHIHRLEGDSSKILAAHDAKITQENESLMMAMFEGLLANRDVSGLIDPPAAPGIIAAIKAHDAALVKPLMEALEHALEPLRSHICGSGNCCSCQSIRIIWDASRRVTKDGGEAMIYETDSEAECRDKFLAEKSMDTFQGVRCSRPLLQDGGETMNDEPEIDYTKQWRWEECDICARKFQPQAGQGMEYRNGWVCSKHAAELLKEALLDLESVNTALTGIGMKAFLSRPMPSSVEADLLKQIAGLQSQAA